MPRGIPKSGRKPKFRENKGILEEIVGHSPPQSVDLPPTHPYPEQAESVNQTSQVFPINHNYPRVVLTESRSIWSDGSVTTEVRSNADNVQRR